jgi:hypothetical protein
MNKLCTLIVALLIPLISSLSFAQQKDPENLFLTKFGQLFEEKDQLKSTLQTITKGQESERIDEFVKKYSIDKEIAKKLIDLRNPFQPALPIPEQESQSETTSTTPVAEAQKTGSETPIVEPPLANQYALTGLVWNTDRPQAILNGKIVSVGDQIEQWTITAINKKGVALTAQNQTFWIEPKGARNVQ